MNPQNLVDFLGRKMGLPGLVTLRMVTTKCRLALLQRQFGT